MNCFELKIDYQKQKVARYHWTCKRNSWIDGWIQRTNFHRWSGRNDRNRLAQVVQPDKCSIPVRVCAGMHWILNGQSFILQMIVVAKHASHSLWWKLGTLLESVRLMFGFNLRLEINLNDILLICQSSECRQTTRQANNIWITSKLTKLRGLFIQKTDFVSSETQQHISNWYWWITIHRLIEATNSKNVNKEDPKSYLDRSLYLEDIPKDILN